MNQIDKANRFRALHAAPGAFVIANAWDAATRSGYRVVVVPG